MSDAFVEFMVVVASAPRNNLSAHEIQAVGTFLVRGRCALPRFRSSDNS
jgi:hypothetical protein